MCGRFNVIDNPGLQQLLQDLGLDLSLPVAVNVAPTEQVPLVRRTERGTVLDSAHWWLTPAWAKEKSHAYAMFNARSETLAKSPAFRAPFRHQRGLVPMSSFIEWREEEGGKQPWLITNHQQALAVAALWDVWEGDDIPMLSCALVTTRAAPAFKPWHTRMPVVLDAAEQERWLDNQHPVAPDDTIFRSALKMPLVLRPVSRAVNNARNKALTAMAEGGAMVELDV